MTEKVTRFDRLPGRFRSALARGIGRCFAGSWGLLAALVCILGPMPEAWGVSSDDVETRLRARLAERIKPRTVAEDLGLSWPVRPTTKSLADVHDDIRTKLAAEVKAKWPAKSFAEFEAEVKATFRIYKTGDEVSVTIRRGPGLESTVKGRVREIGPGTIHIGSRWVARGDLEPRDLAHFEPELAAKEIGRRARKAHNQYSRERKAFLSETQKRLVKELHTAAGYIWRGGDWVSAKELFGSTLSQIRQDEAAVLRPMIEDEIAAEKQKARAAAAEVAVVPEDKGRPWSAGQAIGAPDFEPGKDANTAWAPLAENGGEEWLELRYGLAVRIVGVGIHEALNPGAVCRVTAFTGGAGKTVLWEGQTPRPEAGTVLRLKVAGGVLADRIRICLDTRRVPGWNAIDAVEVVSTDGTHQWAASASASSTFADDPVNLVEVGGMAEADIEAKPRIPIVACFAAVVVVLLAVALGARFRKKRAAEKTAAAAPPPAPGAKPGPEQRV